MVVGKKVRASRAQSIRIQPIGLGRKNVEKYTAREESMDEEGLLLRRILERPPAGSACTAQTKINAFNFRRNSCF